MANNLTGDFDAVLQIAAPAMNALLSVMHQRQTGPITLLHSATVRLEDRDSGVAGIAAVQFAAPTLGVPATGARTRLIVQQPVRARFLADAGTTALPEYLHGDAAITVALAHVADRRVGDALELRFNAAALEDIRFTSAAGAGPLSADDQRRIGAAIRAYVRQALEPVHERIDLGGSVRQLDFRTLAHPTYPALMALASFGRSDLSDRAADEATRLLVDDRHGFAVAISVDYARARLAAVLEGLTAFRTMVGPFQCDVTLEDVHIDFIAHVAGSGGFGLPSTGYTLLSIRGHADVHIPPFGTARFEFSARQMLVPVVDAAGLTLTAPTDPILAVEGPASLLVAPWQWMIVAELRRQRDAILIRANGELRTVLAGAGPSALIERLGVPAAVTLSGIEVLADGIVVRGRIVAEPTPAAVAAFRVRQLPERPGVVELDALQSWVPGGRIDRFRWTSHGATIDESHRFTRLATLDPDGALQSVCLEVVGSQTIAAGPPRIVRASRCSFITAGLNTATTLAPGIASLAGRHPGLYVEAQRIAPGAAQAGIVGHVDLLRTATPFSFNDTNILIYFAGKAPADEVKAIDTWLSHRPTESPGLLVVSVPAQGAPALSAPQSRKGYVAVASAVDPEGAWAESFGVKERPAFVLIARDGEIAWQHAGPVSAEKLAEGIDPRLRGTFTMDWREVRLAVAEGDVAPDFLFEYAKGHQMALRKLKGRPCTICFWTPWSEPSVAELRRLGQPGDATPGEKTPVVLAVCDGAEHAGDNVLKKEGLDVIAVPDPQGVIAGKYGVSCWPTVVEVDAEGLISGVHLGYGSHDDQDVPQANERPQAL